MGVDGLVGLNTQKDYEELRKKINPADYRIFDYYTSRHKGGISGEPIRDLASEQIQTAAAEIRRQGSALKLIHVGGIKTHGDMQRSREIGDPVILREWYTGMMEIMAARAFNQVYKEVVDGERLK